MALAPEVTSSGIANLAKLEHLQEFLYNDISPSSTVMTLIGRPVIRRLLSINDVYFMCLRLLPRLHVSGIRINLDEDEEDYIFDKNISWSDIRTSNKQLPSQLELKQLILNSTSSMPVGVALPNLESLQLLKPKSNFQLNTTLPSLTELMVTEITQVQLEKLLSCVGEQLLNLFIDTIDTLILDKVFHLCPKLRKLKISASGNKGVARIKLKVDTCNLSNLRHLSKLSLAYNCEPYYYEDAEDNDYRFLIVDNLLQILRAAPHLRASCRWTLFCT